ncbi:ATP-dependent zinc metalloprotease FtsH [Epidermidibacterium keratini]|uniref:ATP-dependent zinc metalloprotease FtsH n=1 Tax=Epidermidibacterium keratini TaxID=1891644 RepID=A0A7L4YQD5_9ACTN|nr:ATP-dependent zinc metalloprotease FtsH [Epidermidibacterium keratini]QHC00999.1 ATP-dependent zinc metalloprotease FtsH [Epidermidibacterium keratini]
MKNKKLVKSPWFFMLVAALVALIISSFLGGGGDYTEVKTSVALGQLEDGNAEAVNVKDKEQVLEITLKEPIDPTGDSDETVSKISTKYPAGASGQIFDAVRNAQGTSPDAEPGTGFDTTVTQESVLFSILISILPFIILLGLLFFLMNSMQGGGRGVMQFGKSKAKLVSKDMPKTTFADVAGADEAIEELGEIKDFLKSPARFQAIGAKIPKGVLLFGPPGTGKTLLARAVAGEAGVPFYSISGSDFVEMFVGVGASRVRDLFEQAKANAPAIIFVDEIDAVGRHRGAGMGGGHDEREQTLNQMLVEMDGFDVKGGVILIAATNRPDILDPALLRPGRFDRQIAVDRPDLEGRKEILAVHARGKPLAQGVDLETIARRTPGFTGADLENVLNEAALLTARKGGTSITDEALEEAIDRVIAGPERKTRAMSDKEKKMTAYHESGHALVAQALPHSAPVHKVTILPRGRSLGHTLVLPTEDKYSQTRSEMIDSLAYMLGGRAAEEMIYHDPTTGAQNDIEKATQVARAMVTEYGMSQKLGAVKYGTSESEPFLGRDMGHQRDYSDEVAALIDEEVRDLIELAHDEAWQILTEHRGVLDQMVLELMEKETLSAEDMNRIAASVPKRSPMAPFRGSERRQNGSSLPPVMTPKELEEAKRQGEVDPGLRHSTTAQSPSSDAAQPPSGSTPQAPVNHTPHAPARGPQTDPTGNLPPVPPVPQDPQPSGGRHRAAEDDEPTSTFPAVPDEPANDSEPRAWSPPNYSDDWLRPGSGSGSGEK